jgi:hypothetical protein
MLPLLLTLVADHGEKRHVGATQFQGLHPACRHGEADYDGIATPQYCPGTSLHNGVLCVVRESLNLELKC